MTRYKSKIAFGFWVPVLVLMALPFANLFFIKEWHTPILVANAVLLCSLVFILNILLNTKYSIAEETLRIDSGFFFSKRIEISEIKAIERSDSLIKSPALSFKRLEIKLGKYDSILISPENEAYFINELKSINPKIEVKV